MADRIADLLDIHARLTGKTAAAERVFPSRAWTVPDKKLPAILLYALEEEGVPVSPAGTPVFRETVSFSIQVLVAQGDGWDTQAMAITEQAKSLLFSDPVWLARWKEVPRFTVQQFVDDKATQNVAGEVLSFSVERQRPTEYKPAGAADLARVDTTVDTQTGAPGDALTLTQQVEP